MQKKILVADIIGWLMFIALAALCVANSFTTMKVVKDIDLKTRAIKRCETENEMFWEYVSNLDTMADTSEVMKSRDDLYDAFCDF